MPDKGKIMSQNYYDKQSKLIMLLQESLAIKEMDTNEAIKTLRILGFSEIIAAERVREWAAQVNTAPETEKTKKTRLRQLASLENYMRRMRFGR